FTAQDVRSANKVCIIGHTTATQIYGNENPIGQILRIKNVPFTILGVLTPKGLSPQGVDQDDIVIMPYTSAMKRVIGGTTLRNMCKLAMRARSKPPSNKSFRYFDNGTTFVPVATTISPCARNRKSPMLPPRRRG